MDIVIRTGPAGSCDVFSQPPAAVESHKNLRPFPPLHVFDLSVTECSSGEHCGVQINFVADSDFKASAIDFGWARVDGKELIYLDGPLQAGFAGRALSCTMLASLHSPAGWQLHYKPQRPSLAPQAVVGGLTIFASDAPQRRTRS